MAKKKTASKKKAGIHACPLAMYCTNKGKKCNTCMNTGKGKVSYYSQKKVSSKGSVFTDDELNPLR